MQIELPMSDRSKLSAPTRQLLASASLPESVGLLLRLRAEPSNSDLHRLSELGVHVRSVAGDVLTADAAPGALTAVADEDFVLSIDASGPLYTDSRISEPVNYSDVE